MTSRLESLLMTSIRKSSIALAEEETKNGRDVIEIRSKRHAFPEDVLNRINSGAYQIEGVYALLRDYEEKEHVLVNNPEGFEPIPVVVVGEIDQ